MSTTTAKDLTKEPATSPGQRVGGYVILARLADKARAEFLGGNVGEYHTDCPLDHMLLDWKGVSYDEVRREIEAGADNESLAEYLDAHGTPKTAEEIRAFSDGMEQVNPGERSRQARMVCRRMRQARPRSRITPRSSSGSIRTTA